MIYYTADLHLGHQNILEYEHRPWATTDEMDAALIANWNQTVTPDDTVYVLGDFTLKGATSAIHYLEQLNGRIRLLHGNHDCFMGQAAFYGWLIGDQTARVLVAHSPACSLVETEGYYAHIQDGEHEIILSHFPILYWDGQDDRHSIHLYGHMHSRPNMQHPHPDAYNVGVDVNNYRPVTLQELLGRV